MPTPRISYVDPSTISDPATNCGRALHKHSSKPADALARSKQAEDYWAKINVKPRQAAE